MFVFTKCLEEWKNLFICDTELLLTCKLFALRKSRRAASQPLKLVIKINKSSVLVKSLSFFSWPYSKATFHSWQSALLAEAISQQFVIIK